MSLAEQVLKLERREAEVRAMLGDLIATLSIERNRDALRLGGDAPTRLFEYVDRVAQSFKNLEDGLTTEGAK